MASIGRNHSGHLETKQIPANTAAKAVGVKIREAKMLRGISFAVVATISAVGATAMAQDGRQFIGPALEAFGAIVDQAVQQQEQERLRREAEEQIRNSPEFQLQQIQPGGLTRGQVIIVQQLLLKLGHDVGMPDGIVGPRTMAVVAQLQRRAGTPVTGYPSQQLLDALLEAQ